MKHFAPLLLLVTSLFTMSAYAGDVKPWTAADSRVPSSMEASQHKRFKKKEGYFETYLLTFYAKGGTWIQVRFILTNVGPGDGHGAVDVMRSGPALDGTTKKGFTRYIDKVEASARKMSAAGVPLDLTFRETRLRKTKTGYRITLRAKGYELEADLKAVGPNWRPGTGEAHFPSGGRFGVHLMPTLSTFKGRERVNDGPWSDIRGTGWGEHGYTNMMAHVLSNRFLRFHGRKGKYAISFLELFTPDHFGGERVGYLVVTKGKKVVMSSLAAQSTPTELKTDRKKPNHKVPFKYRIEAKTPDGEPVLVEVHVGRTLHRENVLSTVPGWVRRVIEIFIQPVNYFNRAKFKLTLPDSTELKGNGVSLYSPMKAKL